MIDRWQRNPSSNRIINKPNKRKLCPNEYECKGCHQIFHKGWSDKEAREEFHENFPDEPLDEQVDLVCEDCYQLIMKDMQDNPWKYEGLE
jgi:hypothetical protein